MTLDQVYLEVCHEGAVRDNRFTSADEKPREVWDGALEGLWARHFELGWIHRPLCDRNAAQ